MFCRYCGKKNEDTANFCLSCGKPMKEAYTANIEANDAVSEAIPVRDMIKQEPCAEEDLSMLNDIDYPLRSYFVPVVFSALMLITLLFVPWLQYASYWVWETPNISFLNFFGFVPLDSTAAIIFFVLKGVLLFAIASNVYSAYVPFKLDKGLMSTAKTNAQVQMIVAAIYVGGTYFADRAMRGLELSNKTYSGTPDPEPVIALQLGVVIYFLLALIEFIYAKINLRRNPEIKKE